MSSRYGEITRPGFNPLKRNKDVNLPAPNHLVGQLTPEWYGRAIEEEKRNKSLEPTWSESLWELATGIPSDVQRKMDTAKSLTERWDLAREHLGAVMVPYLRGGGISGLGRGLNNERLQTGLSKLKFPTPTKEAQQALEHYKKKYPRTLGHTTMPLNTDPAYFTEGRLASYTGGQQRGPTWARQGKDVSDVIPASHNEYWGARYSMNPTIAQMRHPEMVASAIRHEATHGAQSVANKRGVPSTGGKNFNDMYNEYMNDPNVGYKNVYENSAFRASMAGHARYVLKNDWNKIDGRNRKHFMDNMARDPDYLRGILLYQMGAKEGAPREYLDDIAKALRLKVRNTFDNYIQSTQRQSPMAALRSRP